MELIELLGDSYKEEMTIEEVAAAIKNVNLVDPSTLPASVSKDVFDKTASELATLKKQAKERMSTDEQAQAKQQEFLDRMASLEKENSRMKQEKTFLSSGYDADTAKKLADCIVEGNTEEFVKAQSAWMAERQKEIYAQTKKELLNATPGLNTGAEGTPPQEDIDLASQLGKSRNATMGNQEQILKQYM